MTLYEMLSKTTFDQEVWIYLNNNYGQCMPIFCGEIEEARADTDGTWMHLMDEVDHYEYESGILLILTKDESFNDRMEKHYSSANWGKGKKERPWRNLYEIQQDIKDEIKRRDAIWTVKKGIYT